MDSNRNNAASTTPYRPVWLLRLSLKSQGQAQCCSGEMYAVWINTSGHCFRGADTGVYLSICFPLEPLFGVSSMREKIAWSCWLSLGHSNASNSVLPSSLEDMSVSTRTDGSQRCVFYIIAYFSTFISQPVYRLSRSLLPIAMIKFLKKCTNLTENAPFSCYAEQLLQLHN